ncbi:MAG: NUDIX hydrolase [Candidatus Zixiibacteriota bacterium]|nr:MAG: NUDIX hydrolase [candidate division Zixibacteria bacterium]
MPKPWRVLRSNVSIRDRWLTVRSDTCQMDCGRVIEPYFVLEYPSWVNMVVLTLDCQIVLVRQYRHGAGEIITEIPCGVVDSTDAMPADAAARELAEETGYVGSPPRLMGSFYANPANQNNRVFSFFVAKAQPTGTQRLDPSEEIDIVLADPMEFLRSVMSGDIELQGMHNSALLLSLPYILRELCGDDFNKRKGLISDVFSSLRERTP